MGLPPPFEKIGKPTVGLLETGLELSDKKPKALHKRQWFNSEYVIFFFSDKFLNILFIN